MVTLSPKPDPSLAFFVGRLSPLAGDLVNERVRMSHILLGSGGLSRSQIKAVPLQVALALRFWRQIITRVKRVLP